MSTIIGKWRLDPSISTNNIAGERKEGMQGFIREKKLRSWIIAYKVHVSNRIPVDPWKCMRVHRKMPLLNVKLECDLGKIMKNISSGKVQKPQGCPVYPFLLHIICNLMPICFLLFPDQLVGLQPGTRTIYLFPPMLPAMLSVFSIFCFNSVYNVVLFTYLTNQQYGKYRVSTTIKVPV